MADAETPAAPFRGTRIADLAALNARLADIAASPEGPAAHFDDFWFDMPIDGSLAPLSPAYRDAVLACYRQVAAAGPGANGSKQEGPAAQPWPYGTGDGVQVGQLLQSIGFIIASCHFRRGHRVLLMGANDGNLALPLAELGCKVTVLDPDFGSASAARRRGEQAGAAPRVLQGAFGGCAVALAGERFDFVIFHLAFQRCDDHLVLLRLIREHLLAPGGRVVLAGEPMLEALPRSWGLNPTVAALWTMRQGGGPLLVFRPTYLLEAFAACGFAARLIACPQTSLGNLVFATRSG